MSTTEKHEVKGRLTNTAYREREYLFPAEVKALIETATSARVAAVIGAYRADGDYVWRTSELPKQGGYRELND